MRIVLRCNRQKERKVTTKDLLLVISHQLLRFFSHFGIGMLLVQQDTLEPTSRLWLSSLWLVDVSFPSSIDSSIRSFEHRFESGLFDQE